MSLLGKIGVFTAVVGGTGLALGFLGRVASGENAVTAEPGHYQVEFENDKVRVIRIKYGAGEKSGMHDHGAGVVVNVTSSRVKFTLPDGTSQEDNATAGSASWADAGSHSAENLSGRAIEALYIELK